MSAPDLDAVAAIAEDGVIGATIWIMRTTPTGPDADADAAPLPGDHDGE